MIAQEPPQHRRAQGHHHVVDRDVETVLDLLDVVEVQLGQRDVAVGGDRRVEPGWRARERRGHGQTGARATQSLHDRCDRRRHQIGQLQRTRCEPHQATRRDLKRAGPPGALHRFRRRHVGFDAAQLRQQVGAGHPIHRGVVDLRHHLQQAARARVGAGDTLDHPHLPQRPAAIQRRGCDVSAYLGQFTAPSWRRQTDAEQMTIEIERIVLDPHRIVQIELAVG